MAMALFVVSCARVATQGPETYFRYAMETADAPPPPHVHLEGEPRSIVPPGTQVQVVQNANHDLFRDGMDWYVTDDGYWYTSRDLAMPFTVVDVRMVPPAILSLPSEYWKHRKRGTGRIS